MLSMSWYVNPVSLCEVLNMEFPCTRRIGDVAVLCVDLCDLLGKGFHHV